MQKLVDGILVDLTQEEEAERAALTTAYEAEQAVIQAQAPIIAARIELEALDKKVPRGLEDLIAAIGTPALLAPVTVEVMTRKAELRTIIRG